MRFNHYDERCSGTLLNPAAANSREVGSGLGGASRDDFIAFRGLYSSIVPVYLTIISASNKPPVDNAARDKMEARAHYVCETEAAAS
jgi:hypothetical protein